MISILEILVSVVVVFLVGRWLYLNYFKWDVIERYPDGTERSIAYGPMRYSDAKAWHYRYESTTGRTGVYFMRKIKRRPSANPVPTTKAVSSYDS